MRVRARFTKLGKVRFTSHRDLARIWERALRKASVPVAYTGGFSPRPRLHFGLALSTGYESLAEYVDVDLDDARLDGGFQPGELLARLSDALPEGIDVVAAAPVEPSADSLQQAVTSCTWSITVDGASAAAAVERIDAVLAAPELSVTRLRKGKPVTDDLRPHLVSLRLAHTDGEVPVLEAELGTQPRSVRPRELLTALHEDWTERRVCRLQQWMSHDGPRREPLAAPGGPSRVRVEACAP